MATIAPLIPGPGQTPLGESRSDADLVAGLRAGRSEAFERFYERYRARIYNLALRIVQTREDARDITQDVFIKAYRQLPGGGGELSLRPWLYRVAINACYDHLRTRKLHHDIDALGSGLPEVSIDTFEQAETSRLLEQTLAGLSERHRAVLVLKDIHGLRHDEIAGILGVSRGATETLLFRARESFRAHYAELSREAPQSSCRVAQDAVAAAAGGALAPAERRRVVAHAAHCPVCRKTVQTWSLGAVGLGIALQSAPLPAALQGSLPLGLTGAGAAAGTGAGTAGGGGAAGVGASGTGTAGGGGAAGVGASGAGAAGAGGAAGATQSLTLVAGGLVAKAGGLVAAKIAIVAVAATVAVTGGGIIAHEGATAAQEHGRPDPSTPAAVVAEGEPQSDSPEAAYGRPAAHGDEPGGGDWDNGNGNAGEGEAASSTGEPEKPDKPDTPDKPDKPDKPEKPDKPDTPDKPDKPDKPEKPDKPDTPEKPDKPDKPDPPDKPEKPDKPDKPDAPDKPEKPDKPDAPDKPEKPDKAG